MSDHFNSNISLYKGGCVENNLANVEPDPHYEVELWAWNNLDAIKHVYASTPESFPRIDFFGTSVYDPWILPDKQGVNDWAEHGGENSVDPYMLYGKATMDEFTLGSSLA